MMGLLHPCKLHKASSTDQISRWQAFQTFHQLVGRTDLAYLPSTAQLVSRKMGFIRTPPCPLPRRDFHLFSIILSDESLTIKRHLRKHYDLSRLSPLQIPQCISYSDYQYPSLSSFPSLFLHDIKYTSPWNLPGTTLSPSPPSTKAPPSTNLSNKPKISNPQRLDEIFQTPAPGTQSRKST
jgi:hypothetical protein